MEKNEVVKNDVVNDTTNKIEVREDLNNIVKLIKFETIKNKYGTCHPLMVTLFNDVKVEFSDKDDIYSLFKSYSDSGEKDFIKSKKLVEEIREDEEGQVLGTYFCVKYELRDGSVYRLFTKNFTSNKAIENYYNLYKKQH